MEAALTLPVFILCVIALALVIRIIGIEITIEKTGLSIKKLTFIFSKVSPRPSPNEREEEFLLNYTFLSISGKGNHSVSFFSADGWGKVALTFIPGVSL